MAIAWLAAAAAQAQERVALVIGNSAYRNVPSLANPANDAKLMADTLHTLGFKLIGDGAQLNLDKPGFDRVVQDFGRELQGARVALFYYAGHGLQVHGSNYLVPVNANPTKEADVDFQMLDANLVLRQMESAGTKLNLVILDACRNNPFGKGNVRSLGSGLVPMQAPEGTLISYATQPGQVAQDGGNGHSPYTSALVQKIRTAGLDLFDTFNEVGLLVKEETRGEQRPWVSSSPINGRFYFAGPPAAAPKPAPGPAADEITWNFVKTTNDLTLLRDFTAKFPASAHRAQAEARIAALERQAADAKSAEEQKQKLALAERTAPVALPTAQTKPALGISPLPFDVKPLSEAHEQKLKPKDHFSECGKCPEMVVVPAGEFTMGSPATEPGRESSEGPQHTVKFAKPFAAGRYAVTFAEWDACVAAGGCQAYNPWDNGWGRGKRPVINISWDDAEHYVAWISKITGKNYRLLSESEYEYIARAGTATPFWWGKTISPRQANYDAKFAYNGGTKGDEQRKTMPVDAFQSNPWGFYQISGNIWEWVEDCLQDDYSAAPASGAPYTAGKCAHRVLRGGSWVSNPALLRSASRYAISTNARVSNVGFRVARSLAIIQ